MRKLFCILILALTSTLAYAQRPDQIELPCPAGSSPVFWGTSFNVSTGKYRQWLCSDNNGNIFINTSSIASTGAINISAGGTNQNITLTPSGTGSVFFPPTGTATSSQGYSSFPLLFNNSVWSSALGQPVSESYSVYEDGSGGSYNTLVFKPTNPVTTGRSAYDFQNGGSGSSFTDIQFGNPSSGFPFVINIQGYQYRLKPTVNGTTISFWGTTNDQITGAVSVPPYQSPPFSSSLTLNAGLYGTFETTLTGNVTSTIISNGAAGQTIKLIWIQDATGGRTVAAPTNSHGFTSPGTTASTYSIQSCTYDGTNWICGVANTNIP